MVGGDRHINELKLNNLNSFLVKENKMFKLLKKKKLAKHNQNRFCQHKIKIVLEVKT